MHESVLQRGILEALTASGFWAMRLNSGTTVLGEGPSKRVIKMAPAGTPDILVLVPYGFLEVKAERGKLNPAQWAWHCKAAEKGIRVRTVRSIREALDVVKEWSNGNSTRSR